MKRSNLEKDFKIKLNQRTIQPAENSWNKLDELLSVDENKKTMHRFNWLYIAASITGIAILGIYTINQNSSINNPEPQLVIQETIDAKDSINSTDKSASEIIINPIQNLKSSNVLAAVKPIKQIKIKNDELILITSKLESNILENTNLIDVGKTEKNTNQKSQISINTTELLAALDNSAKQPINNSQIKVNAANLLNQVDDELEQTFKEKALQSINKNFNNLKTALASRNLED